MQRAERKHDRLSIEEQRSLLSIARETLVSYVERQSCRDLCLESYSVSLRELRSTFVTLRNAEMLRGCVGSAAMTKPLAVSVRDNTIQSATRDPRFQPIVKEEIRAISIEVSVLDVGDSPDTPFVSVNSIDEIAIGRDGLMIEGAGGRKGLLLPRVATDRGWSVEQFIQAVCQKANLPVNAWGAPGVRLHRFTAQVFGG